MITTVMRWRAACDGADASTGRPCTVTFGTFESKERLLAVIRSNNWQTAGDLTLCPKHSATVAGQDA